jgi:uncharacterized membrane protein
MKTSRFFTRLLKVGVITLVFNLVLLMLATIFSAMGVETVGNDLSAISYHVLIIIPVLIWIHQTYIIGRRRLGFRHRNWGKKTHYLIYFLLYIIIFPLSSIFLAAILFPVLPLEEYSIFAIAILIYVSGLAAGLMVRLWNHAWQSYSVIRGWH